MHNEISRLIRQGLGWDPQELPMRKSPMRAGKLTPEEIIELVGRDAARGADGKAVMYGAPGRITKKIKR